jgi:hypothetical protein
LAAYSAVVGSGTTPVWHTFISMTSLFTANSSNAVACSVQELYIVNINDPNPLMSAATKHYSSDDFWQVDGSKNLQLNKNKRI